MFKYLNSFYNICRIVIVAVVGVGLVSLYPYYRFFRSSLYILLDSSGTTGGSLSFVVCFIGVLNTSIDCRNGLSAFSSIVSVYRRHHQLNISHNNREI